MVDAKLSKIAEQLQTYDNFVICGHVNHDGDCISCQVTLTMALRQLDKNVVNLLADTSKINDNLSAIPLTDSFIKADDYVCEFDNFCFVTVDCAQNYRIEDGAKIKAKADCALIIDHHELTDDVEADIYFTDPSAASCSMLIWKLCKLLKVQLNAEIAQAALVGLISDTASFRNKNADANALRLACEMVECGASTADVSNMLFLNNSLKTLELQNAFLNQCTVNTKLHYAIGYLTAQDFEKTGATKNDTTGLVDLLKSIDCVNFVCVLRQIEKGDDIHGSLRAKDDTDVRSLATQYKGGGHIAAAGFTMVGQTDLKAAVDEIYNKMANLAEGKLK